MNLLEFANPIGWWGALLALPIVLLYILKTRMRRQQVSTLLFWDQIFDEKRPRAWWQQLRRLLSLLLQLAILLFLVAALVDPLWSWQQRQQRRMVLVLDNSASMQALEPDEATRLELARQTARALVQSLRGGDQMAILTAGSTPRVAIGMTDHQNSLFEAIDSVPSTDGPTALLPAVEVAERLLADFEGEQEIVVLTDGCAEEIETLASRPLVKLYGIGSERDNVGITRYQVRRSLLDSVGYQVLVDVTSFSQSEIDCRLTLKLEGELVDVLPLTLAPGETLTRVVDHTSPLGGEFTATLDVDDALKVDNHALALLPRRAPLPVVLVTEGNLFLQSVLESIPLVQLQVVTQPPAAAPKGGVLVLDRIAPATLPSGRVLVIDPQGDCDLWKVGEAIEEPIVASVDADSPLTQHVRLTNILFPDARRLEFTTDAETLIEDPLDQALLARVPRRGGDAVVLTCSLSKGDLPLRIAFPVLMKNAIEWFQGSAGELQPATPSGEMATVSLLSLLQDAPTDTDPAGADLASPGDAVDSAATDAAVVETTQAKPARSFTLVSPTAREVPIVTSESIATIGPLLEAGLWTLQPLADAAAPPTSPCTSPSTAPNSANSANSAGETSRVAVACNLVNREESNLRPRVTLEPMHDSTLLLFGGHPLWFYLTLGGLGLLVTEWWLYQRRIVE